jgi:ribulose-phosphate 3-epimerase
MIENPDLYLEAFAAAGSTTLIVHWEDNSNLHRTVHEIRRLGLKAGVAINPATPASVLSEIIADLDLVLVMTVNPGFGGQKFIPNQLRKIEAIANRISKENLDVKLEVDGGIDPETGLRAVSAGANVLVAGTAAFRGGPSAYASNIKALRGLG